MTTSQAHHYQTSHSPKIKISDSPPPTKKRRLGEPSNSTFSEAPYDPNVLQTSQQGAPTQASPYTAGPSTSALPQLTQEVLGLLSSPLLNLLPIHIQHFLAQQGVSNSEPRTQLGNIGSTSIPGPSIQQQQRQTPLSTQSDGINSFTSRSDTTAPTPASPKHEYEEESMATVQKYPRRTGSLSSMPSPNDETRRTSGTGPVSQRSTEKAPAAQLNKGFFFLDGAPSDFYIDMSVKNRKELINIVKVCLFPLLFVFPGPEYLFQKNDGKIVNVMSDADFVVLDNRMCLIRGKGIIL